MSTEYSSTSLKQSRHRPCHKHGSVNAAIVSCYSDTVVTSGFFQNEPAQCPTRHGRGAPLSVNEHDSLASPQPLTGSPAPSPIEKLGWYSLLDVVSVGVSCLDDDFLNTIKARARYSQDSSFERLSRRKEKDATRCQFVQLVSSQQLFSDHSAWKKATET